MLERLRLLNDLIAVKPLEMSYKSLVLPQVDTTRADRPGDPDDTFLATVVATGPGDKLLHGKCRQCGAATKMILRSGSLKSFQTCSCGSTQFELTGESRMPMHTKIGDTVLVPRRPNGPAGIDERGNCAVEIDGERYLLIHEEQAALAKVVVD
jgi:hypothetical protein